MAQETRTYTNGKELRQALRLHITQTIQALPPALVEDIVDGLSSELGEATAPEFAPQPAGHNRIILKRWVVADEDLRVADRLSELVVAAMGATGHLPWTVVATPVVAAVVRVAYTLLRKRAASLSDLHIRILLVLRSAQPMCLSVEEIVEKLSQQEDHPLVLPAAVESALGDLLQALLRDNTVRAFVRECPENAGWTFVP